MRLSSASFARSAAGHSRRVAFAGVRCFKDSHDAIRTFDETVGSKEEKACVPKQFSHRGKIEDALIAAKVVMPVATRVTVGIGAASSLT